MARERFIIDPGFSMRFALVVAADVVRDSRVGFGQIGPWHDGELERDRVVEVIGPQDLLLQVGEAFIDEGVGFEVL